MDADDSNHNSIQINVNLRFASITFRIANILFRLCSKWVYKQRLSESKLNNFNFFSCFSFLWSKHSSQLNALCIIIQLECNFSFLFDILMNSEWPHKAENNSLLLFFSLFILWRKTAAESMWKRGTQQNAKRLKAKLNIWLVNHK